MSDRPEDCEFDGDRHSCSCDICFERRCAMMLRDFPSVIPVPGTDVTNDTSSL